MRADIAERPAAGEFLFQPPDQREIRVHDPILKVGAVVVIGLADLAVFDELLREGHGGDFAVVVHDHVLDAGLFDRREHGLGVGQGIGERLFADDVLARPRGGDGHLGMPIARRRDVHDINVLALDDAPPVGIVLLPAELPRRGRDRRLVPPAKDFHARLEFAGEKAAYLPEGVRVRFAHEFVAQQCDVDVGHCLLRSSIS